MWYLIPLLSSTLVGLALLAFVTIVRRKRIDLSVRAWLWTVLLSTLAWSILLIAVVVDNRADWIVPSLLFFLVAFSAKGGLVYSRAAEHARTAVPDPFRLSLAHQPDPNPEFLRRLEFVVRLEDRILLHAKANGDRCLIPLDSDVLLLGEINQLADEHKCEISSVDAIDIRRAA